VTQPHSKWTGHFLHMDLVTSDALVSVLFQRVYSMLTRPLLKDDQRFVSGTYISRSLSGSAFAVNTSNRYLNGLTTNK
jgi:hypothetical protein